MTNNWLQSSTSFKLLELASIWHKRRSGCYIWQTAWRKIKVLWPCWEVASGTFLLGSPYVMLQGTVGQGPELHMDRIALMEECWAGEEPLTYKVIILTKSIILSRLRSRPDNGRKRWEVEESSCAPPTLVWGLWEWLHSGDHIASCSEETNGSIKHSFS